MSCNCMSRVRSVHSDAGSWAGPGAARRVPLYHHHKSHHYQRKQPFELIPTPSTPFRTIQQYSSQFTIRSNSSLTRTLASLASGHLVFIKKPTHPPIVSSKGKRIRAPEGAHSRAEQDNEHCASPGAIHSRNRGRERRIRGRKRRRGRGGRRIRRRGKRKRRRHPGPHQCTGIGSPSLTMALARLMSGVLLWKKIPPTHPWLALKEKEFHAGERARTLPRRTWRWTLCFPRRHSKPKQRKGTNTQGEKEKEGKGREQRSLTKSKNCARRARLRRASFLLLIKII